MDTLVQTLLTMADSTVAYAGTFESFRDEFQKEIDENPAIARQFGLFDCMVKQRDKEHAERMAKRIALIQKDRQDTLLMDHFDSVMNTLTHGYGFHLVTCPDCGNITSCPLDDSIEVQCPKCSVTFTSNEAPDLYF